MKFDRDDSAGEDARAFLIRIVVGRTAILKPGRPRRLCDIVCRRRRGKTLPRLAHLRYSFRSESLSYRGSVLIGVGRPSERIADRRRLHWPRRRGLHWPRRRGASAVQGARATLAAVPAQSKVNRGGGGAGEGARAASRAFLIRIVVGPTANIEQRPVRYLRLAARLGNIVCSRCGKRPSSGLHVWNIRFALLC